MEQSSLLLKNSEDGGERSQMIRSKRDFQLLCHQLSPQKHQIFIALFSTQLFSKRTHKKKPRWTIKKAQQKCCIFLFKGTLNSQREQKTSQESSLTNDSDSFRFYSFEITITNNPYSQRIFAVFEKGNELIALVFSRISSKILCKNISSISRGSISGPSSSKAGGISSIPT